MSPLGKPREVQLQLEPIVAYKAWQIREDGALFSTGATGWMWQPGGVPSVALCVQHIRAPDFNCQCGLWTCKDLYTLTNTNHFAPTIFALGVVHISGLLVEYESGYRAEKAIPTVLYMPPLSRHLHPYILKAAELYKCVVEPLPEPNAESARKAQEDLERQQQQMAEYKKQQEELRARTKALRQALKDKGLVDSRGSITDKGKELLG